MASGMKTLADMTREEIAELVGMWCDFTTIDGHHKTGVIAGCRCAHRFTPGSKGVHAVPIFQPGKEHGFSYMVGIKDVTPRFDLPRAWTPKGEPVPGEWEEVTTDAVGHIEYGNNIYEPGFGDFTDARRFITEWEELPQ